MVYFKINALIIESIRKFIPEAKLKDLIN